MASHAQELQVAQPIVPAVRASADVVLLQRTRRGTEFAPTLLLLQQDLATQRQMGAQEAVLESSQLSAEGGYPSAVGRGRSGPLGWSMLVVLVCDFNCQPRNCFEFAGDFMALLRVIAR
jgi:hypothetical protein